MTSERDFDYSADETADEPIVGGGYRSYEVYQRERVGETTNLVNPRDLISHEYLADPFAVPAVLRENYPCYRDWVCNRFWVTRYDDVTSIFVDDANFETRPKKLVYGEAIRGADLGHDPEIEQARADLIDEHLGAVVDGVLDALGRGDLSTNFALRLAVELEARVLGLDAGQTAAFATHRDALTRGITWHDADRLGGIEAADLLVAMLQPLLDARKTEPRRDLLSAFAELGATADDVVATLIETDAVTLGASLANLWCLLLTHDDQLSRVRDDPRLMKFAYLEALRHSPPIITADRYTRHEVERFGRLFPQGALVHLSAAAANRDPRQFSDPDRFDIARKDLCQREPRGQYRADGLPAAICFGLGRPSQLPAVPREAPRSRYALNRDVAVAASRALLERFPQIALAPDAHPTMRCERLGGPYFCSNLPVTL